MTQQRQYQHGASEYLNWGCRCPVCTEAWRVRHLEYMHSHPEQMEKSRMRERERQQRMRDEHR